MEPLVTLTLVWRGADGAADQTEKKQTSAGGLLSDALRLHGHSVETPCGGRRKCGKCRIVAQGELSQPCAEERQSLTPQELADGVRLACCTYLCGDASVVLPRAAQLTAIRSTGVMPKFPIAPAFSRYGAAVDIGTTTLAVQLYGADGALLAAATAPNPQRMFGADVISRIGRALAGDGAALADCVRAAVAGLLIEAEQQAGLPLRSVDALVITGNTAMLYLLTQKNPDCLSHAPFEADTLFGCFVSAQSLCLPCAEGAQVYLPRCMEAFVGADITTALLASEICDTQTTALLVDIGTNGEMALWHAGRLLCCSTAAGPAFEGAGLSMGMQGAPGAIDHVTYDAQKAALDIHTIGGAPAKGVCGSGIIDALAALMDAGVLEESGALADDGHDLTDAVCETPEGETAVRLSGEVWVTQADVRQVQLAKSAVCAGMRTLLSEAGVAPEALQTLAVAGGFGSYLSLPSAAKIGLFPAELLPKAAVLGNAALSGAAMLLLNRSFVKKAEALAKSAQTVSLSTSRVFMEQYMECMMFAE